MKNIGNPPSSPSSPPASSTEPQSSGKGKGKGKQRGIDPLSGSSRPSPTASVANVIDTDRLEPIEGSAPNYDTRPASYNYYNPLHQAGPAQDQSTVFSHGKDITPQQDGAERRTSESRASNFSKNANKKAKSFMPEEKALKKLAAEKKDKIKQLKSVRTRMETRRSNRVNQLPSPHSLEVHHDKIDGYVFNKAHEVGKDKAHVFTKAGFKLINEWKRNEPESWRKPAAADPEYQEGRNALIKTLKSDAQSVYATRVPHPTKEKYYTKHTIAAPSVDAVRAVRAKAAWQYDREAEDYKVGRLTTMVPSGYSTEEDEEKLRKLEKDLQLEKGKKDENGKK